MEAGTETEQQEEPRDEQGGEEQDGDAGTGTVEEVQGVVVEIAFSEDLPEINNALVVELDSDDGDGEARRLVLEVQQHLGDDRVRAVAMDATDGLARGVKVRDTGGPITVPVGDVTLGRIFNLLGEVIDEGDEVEGRGALADTPARPQRGGPRTRPARFSRPVSR